MMFADRVDAGRQLAKAVSGAPTDRLIVLGLPRGGVPVAFEVADLLGVPLDIILVRKLGVPGQAEVAMGAIGEDGVRVANERVVRLAGVTESMFAAVEARERTELLRRAARYRGSRARVPLDGCTALIVDDGIATGSTVRAACQVARAHGAARVIVAAPIAPPRAMSALRDVADGVIVLASPASFEAIGQFYDDFTPTSDEEVVALLARSRGSSLVGGDVVIDAGPVKLPGRLTVPQHARAFVAFAHGSGSSRHSARNRFVAEVLERAGFGTLLFDLLTEGEERDRANVFDIELLAQRLVAATRWLRARPEVRNAPVGYFGASTGAAAALWASTDLSVRISAIVSRGGRPDLAGSRLALVRAPTLLIVGGADTTVLDLNRRAAATMRTETRIEVIPGATHLFAEPGTLAAAADLARAWFVAHLTASRSREASTTGA